MITDRMEKRSEPRAFIILLSSVGVTLLNLTYCFVYSGEFVILREERELWNWVSVYSLVALLFSFIFFTFLTHIVHFPPYFVHYLDARRAKRSHCSCYQLMSLSEIASVCRCRIEVYRTLLNVTRVECLANF